MSMHSYKFIELDVTNLEAKDLYKNQPRNLVCKICGDRKIFYTAGSKISYLLDFAEQFNLEIPTCEEIIMNKALGV